MINLNYVFCQEDVEIDTIRLEVFLDDYVKLYDGFLTRLAEIETIESYNSLLISFYTVISVFDFDYSPFSSVLNNDCCNIGINDQNDIRLQNMINDFCDKIENLDFDSDSIFNHVPNQITNCNLPRSTVRAIDKVRKTINRKISDEFREFNYMTWDLKIER